MSTILPEVEGVSDPDPTATVGALDEEAERETAPVAAFAQDAVPLQLTFARKPIGVPWITVELCPFFNFRVTNEFEPLDAACQWFASAFTSIEPRPVARS